MDEKRQKIKKIIENSDISADIKARELEIVNDENLLTPEVEIALAKLIAEEFDKKLKDDGIDMTSMPHDKEVEDALKIFEAESKEAEKDLENDMKIVDDTLKAIRETSEEIQKFALQESLKARI